MINETIRNAMDVYFRAVRMVSRKVFRHGTAESADTGVVFDRDDMLEASRNVVKQRSVKRFHKTHIDNFTRDAVAPQISCRLQGGVHHVSYGQDRHISAGAHDFGFANGNEVKLLLQ